MSLHHEHDPASGHAAEIRPRGDLQQVLRDNGAMLSSLGDALKTCGVTRSEPTHDAHAPAPAASQGFLAGVKNRLGLG